MKLFSHLAGALGVVFILYGGFMFYMGSYWYDPARDDSFEQLYGSWSVLCGVSIIMLLEILRAWRRIGALEGKRRL